MKLNQIPIQLLILQMNLAIMKFTLQILKAHQRLKLQILPVVTVTHLGRLMENVSLFMQSMMKERPGSIHTMNSDGTNRKRLTKAENKWDYGPAWSPDGKQIAFAREYKDTDKISQTEIWIMNSDGSEQTQIKKLSGGAPDFTPDGKNSF